MIALDHISILELLCKTTKKWGMYISFEWEDGFDGIRKAAPYLDSDGVPGQILADGSGIFLFTSQAEMSRYYNQTVGDEGPTRQNNYDGPGRVYAITCNPAGQCMNENT